MSEEYKPLCNEKQCRSKGTQRLGTHHISDYFWQCDNCYQLRKETWRLNHTLLDWDYIPQVNSLDEALNYFTFLQKDRKYGAFEKTETIQGDLGNIAHICGIRTDELDPFRNYWPKYYYYLICYNREFLTGYAAMNFFERVSKSYSSVNWQSVHSKILKRAIELSQKSHGCRIVIIMKSKQVYYVNPIILKTFSYELETEHKLPRESETTCSIPVTKLESTDPYFIKAEA